MRVGRLLAATLITICLGLQLLEATGRWDRTIQDSTDEALIVTVVLCVGAALMSAGRMLLPLRLSPAGTRLLLGRSIVRVALTPFRSTLSSALSPPLPLRI